MEIKLRRIQPEDKGILRHNRNMAKFVQALTSPAGMRPQEVDEAVDWFCGLVVVPEDTEEAKEAILDLSMDEILELISKFNLKIEPDPK